MYTITDKNIDFILEDLSKRGITTESLLSNLLDHICILIESNLEENGDFEQCYAVTIKTFYGKELYQLERETNYLLSQNDLIMKKAMIISGILSAAGFIGGSIGKILLLRITDFLLFLGFASFVLLFLPLVSIVLFKGLKSKKYLLVYGSGILSLMLYFICMLMKCLEWPSSNLQLGFGHLNNVWLIMWLTGLAIGSFIFIPSYLITGIRKPETRMATIITSILLVAFMGVQFRLTNLKKIRSAAAQHAHIKTQSIPETTVQFVSLIDK
jgi:hypothetical protein